MDTSVKLPPHLTQASAPLTFSVAAVDARGEHRMVSLPAERDLTVYLDKRELITLMTLGAHPEWLTLGYLLNQRIIGYADELESITVDWSVNAAAVKTRVGFKPPQRVSSRRVVTSGCGQGSMFADLVEQLDGLTVPDSARVSNDTIFSIVQTIRERDSVYKQAGSVHACALFGGAHLHCFIEDVGRHNALDSIAGWLALQPAAPPVDARILYTTGRLTSEMIIKAAQMGIAVVISRSGITQMGLQLAQRLAVCAIGRALNRHYLCYTAAHRISGASVPPEGGAPVQAAKSLTPK